MKALAAEELRVIDTQDPVTLQPVRSLSARPVQIYTDQSGTTWWGGYGTPTITPIGAEVGDYWVDYSTGDVYRLSADFFA